MFKRIRNKFTTLELSWVLYDVGNSAYTMLICALAPIWFKRIAAADGVGDPTATFAFLGSVVTTIVAFIGPIMGTISDNKGYRKPIFTCAVVLGTLCCASLGFIRDWFAYAIIFVVSKVAYASSNIFYDSMINDVTTDERMDEVSSYGFAWGYIGSCIPFTIAMVFYILAEMVGVISSQTAEIIGYGVTAIWWLGVSIPLIKNYKQIQYKETEENAIINCFKRLGKTLVKIVKYDKKVFYFLIAFFLYIDGVNTIIDNAVNIGNDLQLGDVGLVILLLATQVVAFAFSLIFSALAKKYDTASLIKVCIAGYAAVAIYAVFLRTLFQFGIMAFVVGMFQGAIQALSRSYYGKIIPDDESGEYFGIYDIFNKGATFIGGIMLGIVKLRTGSINIAVGTLATFFVLGFIVMTIADKTKAANGKD